MTSQRTDYDDEGFTEQESINEGKLEAKYRMSAETERILMENERKKGKLIPVDDDFFKQIWGR